MDVGVDMFIYDWENGLLDRGYYDVVDNQAFKYLEDILQ